jgi:NADPH-dependent 7-cyano-7-deazaguanine reductase QueF
MILYKPYKLLKLLRLVRRFIKYRPTIILEEVIINIIEITLTRFCSKRYAIIITDIAIYAR